MTLLWGFTTSSRGGLDDVSAMSEDSGTLIVVEELVDHDSSSGAKRAAGCATSSGRDINVELGVVVLVVLVVVFLARRLPSCLPRNAKTPASFTEPVTTRYNDVSLSTIKKVTVISFLASVLRCLQRLIYNRVFVIINVFSRCVPIFKYF